MVKKRKRKFQTRKRSAGPSLIGGAVHSLLAAMGGCGERRNLATLWQKWEDVLGQDLARMAAPLGHKDKTLLLGAEDSMAMQELSLRCQEILEKVNAFLRNEYFSKIRTTLSGRPQGRCGPRAEASGIDREKQPEAAPAEHRPSGRFLKEMDMRSPVARCYARFAEGPQAAKR